MIFFCLIAINLSPDKCRLQEHFYHNHLEPLSFLLFHQDTAFFSSVAASPSKANYKVKCMHAVLSSNVDHLYLEIYIIFNKQVKR